MKLILILLALIGVGLMNKTINATLKAKDVITKTEAREKVIQWEKHLDDTRASKEAQTFEINKKYWYEYTARVTIKRNWWKPPIIDTVILTEAFMSAKK